MSKELSSFIENHILKNRFNSNASNPAFWSRRDADHLYKEILNYKLQDSDTIQACVYNYINNISTLPTCVCGNQINKFKSFKEGYSEFCSLSCLHKSDKVREKVIKTTLERYGFECALQNKEQYMMDKYGVTNAGMLSHVPLKTKSTKLRLYGSETYNNPEKNKNTRKINNTSCKEVSKRVAAEYLDKYGVDIMFNARKSFQDDTGYDNPSKSATVQQKKKENAIRKYGVNFQSRHLKPNATELIDNKEYLSSKSVREIMEETGYSQGHISKYLIKHGITDIFKSSGEKDICNFIKTFYDGEIIINSRSIIKPLELDIFLPEFNLAIEYNGTYWHSDQYVQTHRTKFQECNNKGIYLLQIFDFQWFDDRTRAILQSMIKIRCNIVEKRIFARKCEIRDVSSNAAKQFLHDNHLDGKCNSSVKYGLFYQEELVSLMTFGCSRFTDNEYELIRFCNKIGNLVIGGANKLLSFFEHNNDVKYLTSFSDNLYSNGNLYKTLGFNKVGETQGFFFVDTKGTKIHRMFLQKHKVKEMYPESFDESLTGKENVKNAGFFLIYDACQSKWIRNLQETI